MNYPKKNKSWLLNFTSKKFAIIPLGLVMLLTLFRKMVDLFDHSRFVYEYSALPCFIIASLSFTLASLSLIANGLALRKKSISSKKLLFSSMIWIISGITAGYFYLSYALLMSIDVRYWIH